MRGARSGPPITSSPSCSPASTTRVAQPCCSGACGFPTRSKPASWSMRCLRAGLMGGSRHEAFPRHRHHRGGRGRIGHRRAAGPSRIPSPSLRTALPHRRARRCFRTGWIPLDTGPSWYLMPQVFEHFFELLGTSAQRELDLELLDPGYRVFAEPEVAGEPGMWVDVPYGEERVRAVFEALEPGAGAVLAQYLESARHAVAMAEKYFLYNPFKSPRKLRS